jgi:hypothetical protein
MSIGTTQKTFNVLGQSFFNRGVNMTIKEAIKTVEKAGTSITKEKLQEAIRKASIRDFVFAKDAVGGFALVRVPL